VSVYPVCVCVSHGACPSAKKVNQQPMAGETGRLSPGAVVVNRLTHTKCPFDRLYNDNM